MRDHIESKSTLASSLQDLQVFTPEPCKMMLMLPLSEGGNVFDCSFDLETLEVF